MKLLLDHAGLRYRFLDIQLERDGSAYVSLDRKPRETASRLAARPGEDDFKIVPQTLAPRKLSYHTTGRVNYHGLVQGHVGFFEPLVDMTMLNSVLLISVPSCAGLDQSYQASNSSNDAVVSVGHAGRFNVCLTFAPCGYSGLNGCVWEFPHFSLCVHEVAADITAPSPQHFVYLPAPSLFENQRIGRNEAELAYVQGEGPKEIIVVGPNGKGEYTMYFAAVMRDRPNVRVELTDPKHRFELLQNTSAHKLTFRIHGKSDLVRASDLRPHIELIELDAEL